MNPYGIKFRLIWLLDASHWNISEIKVALEWYPVEPHKKCFENLKFYSQYLLDMCHDQDMK